MQLKLKCIEDKIIHPLELDLSKGFLLVLNFSKELLVHSIIHLYLKKLKRLPNTLLAIEEIYQAYLVFNH